MRRVCISLCLVLMMISSAWADTFTVSSGESIQDAIDAADPDDTIDVGAGVYYETLTVNETVTLTGAGTATYDGMGDWIDGTLITRDPNVGGQATNQVVHVTAAGVTLGALTVDGRYGFDEGTGQTTNYGIMVEGVSGVTLDNLHVLDSTNHGIELNNADDAILTDVLCERTAFAPGYYGNFQYGLRCVDSDNVDVDGFTAANVRRGIVVFQGYNSGAFEDLSVTGNGDADGYGVGFYTEPTPGWWQPAFGDYEGDLTFDFEGSHLYTGVDYGVYISDELMDKDITLAVDPAAVFDFLGVTANGGWRMGSGSVPDLDLVMADMGLTHKITGPPDTYDYSPTTVWVDDDYCDVCANDGHVWGYDAYDNVQDGVGAVSGSTVNIAAGIYPGGVTIPAATPILLTGAGMTQTFLTGGMLLTDGVDGVSLHNFAISGEVVAGTVIRASNYNNDFSMDYVLIDGGGTRHSYAGGRMTGDVTVTNCEFVNVGGWSVLDSATSGWETVTGTVTFTHNYIHECDGAVAFRGDPADLIDLVDAHHNVWENINDNFSSPSDAWACLETHNVMVLQFHDNSMTNVAENSWGEGQGLQTWQIGAIDIYDNQFVNCWQGIWLPGLGTEPAPTGSIHDNSFESIDDYAVFTTHGGGGFSSGILDARGNWWGDASGPYHPTLNPGGLGNNVSDDVLFDPWLGPGVVEALPASSGPINCGETVTLDFHYTPDSVTPELRGFTITVDCSAELTFGAGDIVDLDVLGGIGTDYFFVIDNGDGTFTIDSAILGGATGLAAEADLFRITFHPVGDGAGTVTMPDVELRDLTNGDIFAVVTGAGISVDCTAPPGVTDLTTAPGHEEVTLSWTMADASDVDHYEIWRAVWNQGATLETVSAYPEYDDDNPLEPVWPADHTAAGTSLEWTKLTTIPDPLPGTAVGYVDNGAPRGVYYYEVYAVDAADNIGPGAGPMNRATNYWLGDVDSPYDGDVDVLDIDELASTYGWGTGDGGYKPEVDVGPTDTNGGFGIPETDSEVDFEDLMIFALNYGNVAPRLPAGGTETPVFVWQRIDATTWALVLAEPCADLKGVHLRAPLPEGVTCEVSLGDLLNDQSGPGFAANAPERGLDAGVALLGRNAVICGQGELVRVSFSQDIQLRLSVTARDGSNGDMEISLATEAEAVTPLRFAAPQNYPNPFNPKTTISFDLPNARQVRLAVYAVDGSLVRMLVDGEMPAGSHEVVWDGRDAHRQNVATGTYFYRIEAGTDSQVHKMLLMK